VKELSNLENTIRELERSPQVERDWLYSPLQRSLSLLGSTTIHPYHSRVFGLPKTHSIAHAGSDDSDHLIFLVWALSFFAGIRLTTTEAGFLDATPVKPNKLVDFLVGKNDLVAAMERADRFWSDNRSDRKRSDLLTAAIHALFLSQNPRHLQFEEFMLLYASLDAIYALARSLTKQAAASHNERIHWMCSLYSMPTPHWADTYHSKKTELAALRNDTFHEALYMGEPLGFALHGLGTNQNLNLEIRALICRLLVAMLGGEQSDYVRSPLDTRGKYGLKFS
jgi:hypothetical protein